MVTVSDLMLEERATDDVSVDEVAEEITVLLCDDGITEAESVEMAPETAAEEGDSDVWLAEVGDVDAEAGLDDADESEVEADTEPEAEEDIGTVLPADLKRQP